MAANANRFGLWALTWLTLICKGNHARVRNDKTARNLLQFGRHSAVFSIKIATGFWMAIPGIPGNKASTRSGCWLVVLAVDFIKEQHAWILATEMYPTNPGSWLGVNNDHSSDLFLGFYGFLTHLFLGDHCNVGGITHHRHGELDTPLRAPCDVGAVGFLSHVDICRPEEKRRMRFLGAYGCTIVDEASLLVPLHLLHDRSDSRGMPIWLSPEPPCRVERHLLGGSDSHFFSSVCCWTFAIYLT